MKQFKYQQWITEFRHNDIVVNGEQESIWFNQIGENGWEIFQIDRETLDDDKENNVNYRTIINCKKEI